MLLAHDPITGVTAADATLTKGKESVPREQWLDKEHIARDKASVSTDSIKASHSIRDQIDQNSGIIRGSCLRKQRRACRTNDPSTVVWHASRPTPHPCRYPVVQMTMRRVGKGQRERERERSTLRGGRRKRRDLSRRVPWSHGRQAMDADHSLHRYPGVAQKRCKTKLKRRGYPNSGEARSLSNQSAKDLVLSGPSKLTEAAQTRDRNQPLGADDGEVARYSS